MNISNLKDVKNVVEDLKKTKRSPPKEILDSLEIIQKELKKIRDFNMSSTENNNVYRRQIKSSLEYNIYKYLEKYPSKHMPEILSLDKNYVEIPIYHFKKSLTKSDIIDVLETLRNLTKIGISHRAINPSHIMFDKNEKVVLIDYGKSCYLNSKPKFYSIKPIYMSRNALIQAKCHELDDLESLGYVLLDLNLHEKLDTYDSKEIFINEYQKIGNDRLRKYFNLIKNKNINYDDYINIFKE